MPDSDHFHHRPRGTSSIRSPAAEPPAHITELWYSCRALLTGWLLGEEDNSELDLRPESTGLAMRTFTSRCCTPRMGGKAYKSRMAHTACPTRPTDCCRLYRVCVSDISWEAHTRKPRHGNPTAGGSGQHRQQGWDCSSVHPVSRASAQLPPNLGWHRGAAEAAAAVLRRTVALTAETHAPVCRLGLFLIPEGRLGFCRCITLHSASTAWCLMVGREGCRSGPMVSGWGPKRERCCTQIRWRNAPPNWPLRASSGTTAIAGLSGLTEYQTAPPMVVVGQDCQPIGSEEACTARRGTWACPFASHRTTTHDAYDTGRIRAE